MSAVELREQTEQIRAKLAMLTSSSDVHAALLDDLRLVCSMALV